MGSDFLLNLEPVILIPAFDKVGNPGPADTCGCMGGSGCGSGGSCLCGIENGCGGGKPPI